MVTYDQVNKIYQRGYYVSIWTRGWDNQKDPINFERVSHEFAVIEDCYQDRLVLNDGIVIPYNVITKMTTGINELDVYDYRFKEGKRYKEIERAILEKIKRDMAEYHRMRREADMVKEDYNKMFGNRQGGLK